MTMTPMIGRVIAFAFAVLGGSLAAHAQQAGKIHRIGFLEAGSPGSARERHWEACRQRLRELGYVDGQNVAVEMRWAHGNVERLSTLAAELVRSDVKVIVTSGTPGALAARKATTTIPIVMAIAGDPVGVGLAASLSRPGGNVTGLTTISAELSAKRLELLRELVPRATRLAVLWDPTNPTFAPLVRETEVVAKSLGVSLHVHAARTAEELDAAFATMVRERVAAVMVLPSGRFGFGTGNPRVNSIAKHRLPAIFTQREYAEAGGLMAYGPDHTELFRRAAVFVDKILRGARPADLPIEQPTKFELIVNLKTAKALGLTVPPSLLLKADEVLQ
jgi:putative ABC transport system substrate-binding protein